MHGHGEFIGCTVFSRPRETCPPRNLSPALPGPACFDWCLAEKATEQRATMDCRRTGGQFCSFPPRSKDQGVAGQVCRQDDLESTFLSFVFFFRGLAFDNCSSILRTVISATPEQACHTDPLTRCLPLRVSHARGPAATSQASVAGGASDLSIESNNAPTETGRIMSGPQCFCCPTNAGTSPTRPPRRMKNRNWMPGVAGFRAMIQCLRSSLAHDGYADPMGRIAAWLLL